MSDKIMLGSYKGRAFISGGDQLPTEQQMERAILEHEAESRGEPLPGATAEQIAQGARGPLITVSSNPATMAP